MIELKHITKIYKTKGGVDVRALDDVSLTLPETGLVFVLGKSGCGKSTLLNIAGGLDTPSSGEIVVKGRSSKDFSASDFDSYRNTFVGFIFQEYNVLPEFSVKNNISLATELQGKKEKTGELDEVLGQVELTGLENRKPNTLSGGQKQRVAIARALIKNPQIILADEPTGALDSNTGKAVLDLLKKLSESKLVVVVSHDREFALRYADRIIELHDGRILSDGTLTTKEIPMENGCAVLGSDVHVTEALEAGMLEKLNDLLRTKKRVTLTLEEKDTVLTEHYFASTDESSLIPRQYTAEESKLIRSKFPLRYALRMGASGLKSKPFRLVMTILLSTVALTAFGFFLSLMTYNSHTVLNRTLANAPVGEITVRQYRNTVMKNPWGEWKGTDPIRTTDEQRRAFEEETGLSFLPLIDFGGEVRSTVSNFGGENYYNMTEITAYAPFSEEDLGSLDRSLVCGHMPQSADEIVISQWFADSFVTLGYVAFGEEGEVRVSPKSYGELLGLRIDVMPGYWSYDSADLKIVGVFSCPQIDAKYDALKEVTESEQLYYNSDLYALKEELFTLYNCSFASCVAVHKDFAEAYRTVFESTVERDLTYMPNGSDYGYCRFIALNADEEDRAVSYFDGHSSIGRGEAVLSCYAFLDACENVFWYSDLPKDEFFTKAFGEYYDPERFFVSDYFYDPGIPSEAWSAICLRAMDVMKSSYSTDLSKLPMFSPYKEGEFELVGICVPASEEGEDFYGFLSEIALLCDEDYTEYFAIVSFDPADADLLVCANDDAARDRLTALDPAEGTYDSYFLIDNSFREMVDNYTDMVDIFSKVFLWVGIVNAIFASLLLFNFISVSISYKKKDIGILRALGARKIDVFKVFYSESLMIIGSCYLFSAIGSIVLVNCFDNLITEKLSVVAKLFYFGPLQALILLALAMTVAFLSTVFPVNRSAKKPPVDAIRAL